jgi:hypothetical protein
MGMVVQASLHNLFSSAISSMNPHIFVCCLPPLNMLELQLNLIMGIETMAANQTFLHSHADPSQTS